MQQNYVGYRKIDKEGFIVQDNYCLANCQISNKLKSMGFFEERKYYSWKYADLIRRIPIENECCNKQPFDSKYLYATFLTLELTFEYLPILFFLALIAFWIEYFKKRDLNIFGEDFIKSGCVIQKVNTIGLILILIIVLYNLAYLNTF